MNVLTLQPIPNQSFTTIVNSNRYDISIFYTAGVMSITVLRNSILIVDSMRLTAGTFVLPYGYMEDGNFIIVNMNDDLIDYNEFGSTQKFLYLSPQDLVNVRS